AAQLEAPSVYDVAPTLLYLSGLPSGEDMPGRVLTEGLDPAELASNPARRIPSYEDVGPPREAPAVAASSAAQQEMVENLQALGYVGPVAASPTTAPGAGRTAPAADVGDAQSRRVTYYRNMATYYLKAGRPAE